MRGGPPVPLWETAKHLLVTLKGEACRRLHVCREIHPPHLALGDREQMTGGVGAQGPLSCRTGHVVT